MGEREHRPHHRPMVPGAEFFAAVEAGGDPALLQEAADQAATLLVRGARDSTDAQVTERLVRLGETEGMEVLADLWAGSPPDSLAGALWRLYALRAWVHADAEGAAEEFEAGRRNAQVARVVAGVADPPGPDQLRTMVDQVLRGIAEGDFADTVHRAAAFAHVVAVGRATLGREHRATARMLALAEQLEAAGRLELRGELG